MAMLARTLKRITHWLLPALLVIPTAGQTAPGPLADVPLFLSDYVKPNVMLMVDDSGSMDSEMTLSNAALETFPWDSESGNIDPTPNAEEEWRQFCSAYNSMAYDPDVEYTPWSGTDEDGNAYEDAPVNAAPYNAYYTDSDTVDLENDECQEGEISSENSCPGGTHGFFYVQWNDANTNGELDENECLPDRDDMPADGTYQDNVSDGGLASIVWVSDMTSAEKQNYANWFTYYRKREYVAKRALSELIAGADMRMGLGTLHNNNNVQSLVADIGDSDPDPDKATLLDNISRIYSNGGTPLRNRLEDVGQYYDQDDSNDGGFGSSPILPAAEGGACQQNFTIVMSDGYWNGGSPDVGDTDGDNDTAFDGGSHADEYSNTLADVAMKYFEEDLADGLDNLVPTKTGVDENDAQHLVTFTVAFGVNGTLDDGPTDRDAPFDWPEPSADAQTTIDDMRHAAWNGRGAFLSAKNPTELINGLRDALSEISDRVGSATGISSSTTDLKTDTRLFQALFDSGDWSGDLLAYTLDENGRPNSTAAWSAAEQLDDRSLDFSDDDFTDGNAEQRAIFTYNGSSGAVFTWSELTDSQKADLRTNPAGTLDDEMTGMARLRYLRGDHSQERKNGGTFRNRESRLGDIVHSRPAPHPNEDYVFVGANDGMLHAFNANTGEEAFAYVPDALFSTSTTEGLHYLTNPDYSHRYHVDLEPDVRALTAGGTTLLIGGLRGGGRGYFALDVTNPAGFGADDALWEFTSEDDADLGYSYSRPVIDELENGQWAVVFGNGYNDPSGGSADGQASLFIIRLNDDGTMAGTVKIATGAGAADDRNGLATPVLVDVDGNGLSDRAYAGDLQGNLWAFDLSSDDSSDWQVANAGSALFTATDDAGNGQPITTQPLVVAHPTLRVSADNTPNMMVLFGTGQFLTSSDKSDDSQQSYYGVWDRGVGDITRDNLQEQTFTDTIGDRESTNNEVDWSTDDSLSGGDFGWYLDLAASKERVVENSLRLGPVVFFPSQIPEADGACSSDGAGFINIVNIANGGQVQMPLLDLDDDPGFDEPPTSLARDSMPRELNRTGDIIIENDRPGDPDDDTESGMRITPARGFGGFMSWEELTPGY